MLPHPHACSCETVVLLICRSPLLEVGLDNKVDGAWQYDNKYTGDLEITSIPASNIPKDHTVSVGFKDLGARLLQPIVGYATEVNLETAQPK